MEAGGLWTLAYTFPKTPHGGLGALVILSVILLQGSSTPKQSFVVG